MDLNKKWRLEYDTSSKDYHYFHLGYSSKERRCHERWIVIDESTDDAIANGFTRFINDSFSGKKLSEKDIKSLWVIYLSGAILGARRMKSGMIDHPDILGQINNNNSHQFVYKPV